MTTTSRLLVKLLRIDHAEVTFARRGFRMPRDSERRQLERVGESFRHGYHAALADQGPGDLSERLAEVDPEFSGFAYEGAAMALDLLDQLRPWTAPRVTSFLAGPGNAHTYMVHVGVGWSMARLRFRIQRRLSQLDPLLRWLALDGFGFHQGYFHWPRYANGRSQPVQLRGYELRAFDQGLGRSLWFVCGADPNSILSAVSAFSISRRADLWSGIGLACAYAGGSNAEDIEHLRETAGGYLRHLAQGAVFAAKARERAGNLTPHTERACRLLCELSSREAAAIADESLAHATEGPEPAYEDWRRRIRTQLHIEDRDKSRIISQESLVKKSIIRKSRNPERPRRVVDGAKIMQSQPLRGEMRSEMSNGEIGNDEVNTDDRHGLMLKIFAALMIAHWSEHLVQAYQVYALGYERHHARGLLGQIYPWLMHSEWLHFGFAVLTFAGLLMLVRGFNGPARTWWNVALVVQTWHLFEHTLLFAQAQGGFLLWGAKEPTSVLQLLFPRIELHLFYNSVVTVPIVVAMLCWRRDRKAACPPATAVHDAQNRRYAPTFQPQSQSIDEGGI